MVLLKFQPVTDINQIPPHFSLVPYNPLLSVVVVLFIFKFIGFNDTANFTVELYRWLVR